MEGKYPCVQLSYDATFSDFFAAIDVIEEKEGLDYLHFEEELWDNFEEAVVEEILAFRDPLENEAKAGDTKVIDFFNERGYTREYIEIYLPIRFSS